MRSRTSEKQSARSARRLAEEGRLEAKLSTIAQRPIFGCPRMKRAASQARIGNVPSTRIVLTGKRCRPHSGREFSAMARCQRYRLGRPFPRARGACVRRCGRRGSNRDVHSAPRRAFSLARRYRTARQLSTSLSSSARACMTHPHVGPDIVDIGSQGRCRTADARPPGAQIRGPSGKSTSLKRDG
jgi:hypothetical protein